MAGEQTDPGRSLADILREAGVDAPTRPGRRRRSTDPEPRDGVDPAAQRRFFPEGEPLTGPGKVVYGRRATDVVPPVLPATGTTAFARAEPTTEAIDGLRVSRKPEVPGPPSGDRRAPTTGPRTVWTEEQRAAERKRRAALAAAAAAGESLAPEEEDEEPLTGLAGVLAWLRFGLEIVAAAAVGIAVHYVFSLLWDLAPYAAVVAAPLAVTGLVGGVGWWRQRRGRGPVGLPLLLVLLFAGTLLVIVPAAGLLSPT
ncbi:hypothetical protein GB931_21665 [Modestobacter sp. I12A-02628]|uniref:Uncharacterized protein n=1 Tax=Goekera deserti TaxID=2497753 RepID=A0A7K3W939_9ACTN|nr:hypothetical protein [Goekera deserti]MPR00483.1 hypothetical protein [Goekera deserti]NDI49119.1 hypothetical protein [Goekera deserti]NEL52857.1 hypothetical protein [Goekera deserti]